MRRHAGHKAMPFWRMLKTGYDDFELTRIPPKIDVCERRYLVNVNFSSRRRGRLNASGRCPRYQRANLVPFLPTEKKAQQLADQRLVAPGPKRRIFAFSTPPKASQSRNIQGQPGRYYGLGHAAPAR